MHVNAGEHLRILLCALGFKLDGDILDRLAALLKDMNHIVRRTAPQSNQHQFHGTWSRTASIRPESRAKHDLVPAPGLADERAVFNPFDPCLHQRRPSAMGLSQSEFNSIHPPLARLAENWHRPSPIRQDAHFGPAEPENNPTVRSAPRIGSADGALRWVRDANP